MEYHSSPGSHGGTPQQYPSSAHRTAENAIGYFSHSILAREVVRLQEAKAALLRQDASSMDGRVGNLRQEIANIELQAQTDTLSLAKEVCFPNASYPVLRNTFYFSAPPLSQTFPLFPHRLPDIGNEQI